MKIFVSYAREDVEDVEQFVSFLEETEGVDEVWWDKNILPGRTWTEELNHHILSSDIFLFMISNAALASVMCKEERTVFISRKIKIFIPVFFDKCDHADLRDFKAIQSMPLDARGKGLKPIRGGKWRHKRDAFESVCTKLKELIYHENQVRQAALNKVNQVIALPSQPNLCLTVLRAYLKIFNLSISDLEELKSVSGVLNYLHKEQNVLIELWPSAKWEGDTLEWYLNDAAQRYKNVQVTTIALIYDVLETTRQGGLTFKETGLEVLNNIQKMVRRLDLQYFIHVPDMELLTLYDHLRE